MKRLALNHYLFIGTSLRFLQDATPSSRIHGWGQILYNLENFSSEIQNLNLRVTYQVFRQKHLDDLLVELKQTAEDDLLTGKQAKTLSDGMDVVREALFAEAQNLPVYLLLERRFELQWLVSNPEKFLHDGTFAKLSPIAQNDLREAGRCIAFDTPTAAGFLLLRSAESMVRVYYGKYFKVRKEEKLMWGPMITRLRNKSKKPRPDRILLDHLDNIRLNFRNPTDHPEKTYGIDEVQDLLSLVADVLNRIAVELP